jgi:hypothetical protein
VRPGPLQWTAFLRKAGWAPKITAAPTLPLIYLATWRHGKGKLNIEASLGYIAKPCIRKTKREKRTLEKKSAILDKHKNKSVKFKKESSWALVSHTCNPSYLGGRDWEDQGLRPAQANNLQYYLQNNWSKID